FQALVLITINLVAKKLTDLLHYLMSRSDIKTRTGSTFGHSFTELSVRALGCGSSGALLRGRTPGRMYD
ncbi:TPA: hypothetical protein ACM2XI_003805, partial [Enterobacter hormaechei]